RAKMTATEHIAGVEQSCPANICNHGLFNAILADDHQTALEIVRDKMLFARTCGDICHRPCEQAVENSIPIKQLKHYVSSDEVNFDDLSNLSKRKANKPENKHQVAIIGAGPAGLSASYDLALAGYGVVVYEKENLGGGVLQHQIPDFRMDKTGLQAEISMLQELGVKIEYGISLGEQINLKDLSNDFDAVVLAIGVGVSASLDVIEDGIDPAKRFNAMDFLQSFNNNNLDLKAGSTLVVIGGGNSAMDAARAAKKLSAVERVVLSCIEDESNIPAFKEEVSEALAEGIEMLPNSFVADIKTSEDNIHLDLKAFDSKQPLTGLDCDYVITAIGQRGDEAILADSGVDDLDSQSRVKANKDSKLENPKNFAKDNVFVAGDILSEHHMSLIGAIGGGKKAAIGVRRLLEDYQFSYEGSEALDNLSQVTEKNDANNEHHFTNSAEMLEKLKIDIRQYDLHQTCERCNHCIDNFGCPSLVRLNGKITIDQSSCIRCGLCIDVCPNDAIGWQPKQQEAV
ncbi:MAG: hypothetical protein DRQ47_07225, partial [Gammaproteobacteria bacterium]